MPHEIFISYAHEDKLLADALCATLEKHGIRCWIAPRDVPPGNWGAAIVEAIESSQALVLVFSAHSNRSPQVHREVERAVSRGLSVVPVRVEDVPLSKEMQYYISTVHWLDALTPPVERHLDEIANKLKGLLGRQPSSPATPLTPAEKAVRKKSHRGIQIAIAATLAMLATLFIVPKLFKPKPGTDTGADLRENAKGGSDSGGTGLSNASKDVLEWVVSPKNLESAAGWKKEMEASARGEGDIAYRWEFKSPGNDWTAVPGANSGRLEFPALKTTDAGQYRVIAWTSKSSITSAPVSLTIIPPVMPRLTVSPQTVTLKAGQNLTLGIKAYSDSPMTYLWQFKPVDGDWQRVGENRPEFIEDAARVDSAGQYRVVVSNVAGAVTGLVAVVKIIAPEKPVIVRPPAARQISAQQDATFEVSASGDAPLTYEWEFKPRNATAWMRVEQGTAARLVVAHATKSSAGLYRVTVRNSVGETVSEPVELAVTPVLPVISIQTQDTRALGRYYSTVSADLLRDVAAKINESGKFQVKVAANVRSNPRDQSVAQEYALLISASSFETTVEQQTKEVNLGLIRFNVDSYTFVPKVDYAFKWQLVRGGVLVDGKDVTGTIAGAPFKMPVTNANRPPTLRQAEAKANQEKLYPVSELSRELSARITDQLKQIPLPEE